MSAALADQLEALLKEYRENKETIESLKYLRQELKMILAAMVIQSGNGVDTGDGVMHTFDLPQLPKLRALEAPPEISVHVGVEDVSIKIRKAGKS